ncbi:MAG: TonB-dependent receptor [Gemmatimonadaceae bacterium]
MTRAGSTGGMVGRGVAVVIAALLARSSALAQETAVVRGVVSDSLSTPVPGVRVTVVGMVRGATTDSAGRYRLGGVASGVHRLRASRLGFIAAEQVVTVESTETVVDWRLMHAASLLEGVVVVGYGTQSTRNVAGSVASVPMERIETQMVEGVDKALAGQIAGVQVIQSNGIPGGGPQIQIRGVGAIGAGSQPLYVVDGYPLPTGGSSIRNPLNDIPPGDIASISVLKDASSAAIYGSRAANGVVVITTKSGTPQSPRFRVDYATGVQTTSSRGRPDVLNGQEFAQFMKESAEDKVRYTLKREPTLADVPLEYRTPSQYGKGTNWFSLITRQAPTQNLNVSVAGGTTNVSAYVSGGLLREAGTVVGTDYTRSSARASVTAAVGPRIRLGVNVAPTYSVRQLPVVGGNGRFEAGSPGAASVVSPLVAPYDATGAWVPQIRSPGTLPLPNPLMYLDQYSNRTAGLRGIGNTFAELEVAEGLKLRSTANADLSEQQTTNYRPSTLAVGYSAPPRVPEGAFVVSRYVDWLSENTLTLNRTLRGEHHIEVLGGMSVQADRSEAGNFNGTNYPDDDIRTLNGAALITGSSDAQRWGLLSYVSRLNYDYAGKYLLTAAVRRDGSSRFAPAHRWGTFPSIAVGWRVSDEAFLRDKRWIDDLKLRLSYGQTGNNDLGNYSYVGQVRGADYVLNNTLTPGRALRTLSNPDLGWEKTREVNGGVDLTAWNNRVTVTVEAYNRLTDDLLLDVQVPLSSGFGTVTRNTGQIQNRGLELALHTVNADRPSLRWTSDITVGVNRNKVLALGADGSPILSGRTGEGSPTHITMIGQPVGMFYGYVFQGLYKDSADVANSAHFPGAIPGNIKYRDVNGDGNITPISDFEIIGNPYPDATFGLTNSLTVGRFDLSIVASGQFGGQRLEGYNEYLHNIDGVFNVTRDVLDRWRSPAQPGGGRVPTTAGVSRGRVLYRDISSLWVHDASNLWVRNITLRYRLADGAMGLPVRDGGVYVGVQNPAIISGYPGNPEASNYNRQTGPLTPGYDAVAYPIARVFTIGTQLSF